MSPEQLQALIQQRVTDVDEMLANVEAVKGKQFVEAVQFAAGMNNILSMFIAVSAMCRALGCPPDQLAPLKSGVVDLLAGLSSVGIKAMLSHMPAEEGKAAAQEVLQVSRQLARKTTLFVDSVDPGQLG